MGVGRRLGGCGEEARWVWIFHSYMVMYTHSMVTNHIQAEAD